MIGGVAINVGSVLPRPDAIDAPGAAGRVRCDVCHRYDGTRTVAGRVVIRIFGLEVHRPHQKGRGRHAGRIGLCEPCWRGLGRP